MMMVMMMMMIMIMMMMMIMANPALCKHYGWMKLYLVIFLCKVITLNFCVDLEL